MHQIFAAIDDSGQRLTRGIRENCGGVEAEILSSHGDRVPRESCPDLIQEPWREGVGLTDDQRSCNGTAHVAAAERRGACRCRGSPKLDPTAAEAIRVAYSVVDTHQPR